MLIAYKGLPSFNNDFTFLSSLKCTIFELCYVVPLKVYVPSIICITICSIQNTDFNEFALQLEVLLVSIMLMIKDINQNCGYFFLILKITCSRVQLL